MVGGCLGLAGCGSPQQVDKVTEAPSNLIASCALCHSADGRGIEARSAPRLAGQDAAYLERQLAAFADGTRGGASGDAFGPQMAVIAKSLEPAARKEAASYYSALGKDSEANNTVASSAMKPEAFTVCASCHGESGEGMPAIGAPRLAGQPSWYLERSLRLYRDGGRGSSPNDPFGQQMAAASKPLSDADIAKVAVYASVLGSKPR